MSLSDTISAASAFSENYSVTMTGETVGYTSWKRIEIVETVKYRGLSLKGMRDDFFDDDTGVHPVERKISLMDLPFSQSVQRNGSVVLMGSGNKGYEATIEYRQSLAWPLIAGSPFVSMSPNGGKNLTFPLTVTLERQGASGTHTNYVAIPLYHEGFGNYINLRSSNSPLNFSLPWPAIVVAQIDSSGDMIGQLDVRVFR